MSEEDKYQHPVPVGGKTSVYSPLDPPELTTLVKLETETETKGGRKSSIRGIYNDNGSRKTSTLVNLNISFDKSKSLRNAEHWPLSAVVREITANMIDAGLESTKGVIENPVFKTANTLSPVSGFHALSGSLAGSFTLSITEVFVNPETNEERDTAQVAPEFVEKEGMAIILKSIKLAKEKRRSEESEDDDDMETDDEYVRAKESVTRWFRVALYVRS